MSEATDTPAWQERARARSLSAALERVDEQAERLLEVAQELISEETDITVPVLVKRAGMSSKTFYRHFASRDHLLLAALEEELTAGAAALRRRLDRDAEPGAKLRTLIIAFMGLAAGYQSSTLRRSRIQESRRLQAMYPDEARDASAALRAVVHDVIQDLVDAGMAEADDVALTSRSIYHMLSGLLTDAACDDAPDAYTRLGEHAYVLTCNTLRCPQPASGTAVA